MTQEVVTKTFEDIINAVLERGKIATSISTVDSNTLSVIKRMINERYETICETKTWPWREDERLIVTEDKITSGTASVTNGQKEVTLSTGTVDDTFEGRYFRVESDNEYYEIISVNDGANRKFLLAAPYQGTTNATASYTVFKNKYGLFPDYSDIVEVTPFASTSIFSPRPLEDISSEEMTRLQSTFPFKETQYPTHYTIRDTLDYDGPEMGENFVMGYDFMGEGPETQSIEFYPNIFDSNVIKIKYGIQLKPLVNNTDEPLIPYKKRRILVYGTLADWFYSQNKDDMGDKYEAKYEIDLARLKADFDKTEGRMQFVPVVRSRRRTPRFRRVYPDTTS